MRQLRDQREKVDSERKSERKRVRERGFSGMGEKRTHRGRQPCVASDGGNALATGGRGYCTVCCHGNYYTDSVRRGSAGCHKHGHRDLAACTESVKLLPEKAL